MRLREIRPQPNRLAERAPPRRRCRRAALGRAAGRARGAHPPDPGVVRERLRAGQRWRRASPASAATATAGSVPLRTARAPGPVSPARRYVMPRSMYDGGASAAVSAIARCRLARASREIAALAQRDAEEGVCGTGRRIERRGSGRARSRRASGRRCTTARRRGCSAPPQTRARARPRVRDARCPRAGRPAGRA